jgi:nucleotide-binding universal stress UspA family protein
MKNIVVATDFSNESDRALMRAVKLATRRNTTITLVHAVDCEPADRAAAEDRAERRLDAAAQELHEEYGLMAMPRVITGSVADGIVEVAERAGADLIVMGSRDRSLLSGILLGRTVDRVARAAEMPVLVVKAEPEIPYRLGLAAVDFTDCSRLALERMLALGIMSRGRLAILHVFDVPAKGVMHYIGIERDRIDGYVSEISGKAMRQTQDFLADVDFGPVGYTIVLKEGKPADTIRQAADEFLPDLLIIGKHERSAVTRAFLGSVAEDVLLHARQDVLVIPSGS